VALIAVFLLAAVFYCWRASFAEPLSLHGGRSSQYNQLADAFLHLHLWVVHIPNGVLGAGNPYNPAQRPAFLFNYPDYSLYGHYLYITWGPVPALVLLIPLHLLGFEPSGGVISTPFAIVGLGFALAAMRVILRRIGDVSLWMCILAALTLSCASLVPFILRFPLVYHEEIASAYCFAMAGVWLAVSAVVDGRSSLKRLALLSLCLGLATGSRVTLALMALVLIPVYTSLRTTRPRRGLIVALGVPFGGCVMLLLAYNQARFGNPLQYGAIYQINGVSTYEAHLGELGYLPPGLWSYLIAPPRLSAIFPFLQIVYPQISYPLSLPAHYAPLSEETGGLLAMAPIALFLVGLPWMWRRRPELLGGLAPLLLAMAGAGAAIMVFVSYEIYISSERYETDYMTLLLLGGLTVWLVLSSVTRGRARRLVRAGGGLLAVWSCVTGLAISALEIEKHTGTWRTLVSLGSPLSTTIATLAGHPVLAEVYTPDLDAANPSYSLGTDATGFWMTPRDEAVLTIVSPDRREAALLATVAAGPALTAGSLPEAHIRSAGHASYGYRLPPRGGAVRIPLHLDRGVNQIVLSTSAEVEAPTSGFEPESSALVVFSHLSLASR
jgi:hypothetical protein